MKCNKCGKNCEEGFLYDGREWSFFDKEAVGLDLYSFFCRDCVEKVLCVLVDETINKIENPNNSA